MSIRMPLHIPTQCLFFLLVAMALAGCDGRFELANERKKATAAEAEAEAANLERGECASTIEKRVAEYHRLMAKHDYWNATIQIRLCANRLDDPALRSLVADGELKSHLKDINNPKSTDLDRIRAIEALQRINPEVAKQFESLHVSLSLSMEARSRDTQISIRRNSPPVVGGAPDDALSSSWGRPSQVNRTTTARGVREQWVYGGGRYLYFENDVLIAIQE